RGLYNARTIRMGEESRIEAKGPVELRIEAALSGAARVFLGPAAGVALSARDIRVEVAGSPPGMSSAVVFGEAHEVRAVVLAPLGQVELTGGEAVGAFLGRVVRIGDHERVTFQDGWSKRLDFAAPRGFSAGASPVSVAAGDFDGDHRPDLAVANAFSEDVTVLLGNGDG